MHRLSAPFLCCLFLAVSGVSLEEEVDFEKLENELWQVAKDLTWPKLKSMVALGYQEVDEAGRRERKAALKDTATEKMSDFKLSDFKVTRNGPTVVVTYYADVAETIGGNESSCGSLDFGSPYLLPPCVESEVCVSSTRTSRVWAS